MEDRQRQLYVCQAGTHIMMCHQCSSHYHARFRGPLTPLPFTENSTLKCADKINVYFVTSSPGSLQEWEMGTKSFLILRMLVGGVWGVGVGCSMAIVGCSIDEEERGRKGGWAGGEEGAEARNCQPVGSTGTWERKQQTGTGFYFLQMVDPLVATWPCIKSDRGWLSTKHPSFLVGDEKNLKNQCFLWGSELHCMQSILKPLLYKPFASHMAETIAVRASILFLW